MLLRILLFCLCCSTATAQAPLQGGWQLTGIASQQEMPKLSGNLKLFIYPKQEALLQLGNKGASQILPAKWEISGEDQSLLMIKTEEDHFLWNIQLLEENNLVLEDVEDKAILNFQPILTTLSWKKMDLVGNWLLAEKLGEQLDPQASNIPKLNLSADAMLQLQNWPDPDSLGQWAYIKEGNFLKFQTKTALHYYELLFVNQNYLLIQDGMLIYIFQKKNSKILNFRQAERKLYGHWEALNPQYPIKKAALIFRKDGSVNAISNLNTSLNRWELTTGNKYIQFHPYQTESKEESYLLRLRFVDKNTIILSDKEMTVLFKKKP